MIGECLANEAPFGVVRALEEGIAEVGCTAEIITVTKEYPDGRLDLIAEGRKRFEVLELNQERSFLRAEVLLVPDEPRQFVRKNRSDGRFSFISRSCRWQAPCRIFRRRIRTSFRFIWRGRCRSISTSSRSCWPCGPRASAFRRSRTTWKASFPNFDESLGRGRRPEGTGMRTELSRFASRNDFVAAAYNQSKFGSWGFLS